MMTPTRLFRIAVTTILLIAAAACSRDPHGTALPLNLADIPKIQPQLDKLPADERQLVLDYLKRSNGDVLPANLADPSAPLTARTFAQAIKLQREFAIKDQADKAKFAEFREAREATMDPLRAALALDVARREIVTADEALARQPSPGQAIHDAPVVVTTYRLQNKSSETITHVTGSVSVRSDSDPDSLMGLARCFIDRAETISSGQTVEVRCGDVAKRPSEQDKEYIAMAQSSLIVRWEPRSITFEGGKVLASGQ